MDPSEDDYLIFDGLESQNPFSFSQNLFSDPLEFTQSQFQPQILSQEIDNLIDLESSEIPPEPEYTSKDSETPPHPILNAAEIPSILWPDPGTRNFKKGLEFGPTDYFSLSTLKNDQNSTSHLPDVGHFGLSFGSSQPILWEPRNSNPTGNYFFTPLLLFYATIVFAISSSYWIPKSKIRLLRPPIRKHELSEHIFANFDSVDRNIKQFQYYEPGTDVPPAILESYLKESLHQEYLLHNMDPLLGNRSCIFTPEILAKDLQSDVFKNMNFLAYTGGDTYNELRFYPIIRSKGQNAHLSKVDWDGLNINRSYKSSSLTPICQLSISPTSKEFLFCRSYDQISLLETQLNLIQLERFPESIPITYQKIGYHYSCSNRNRFINHVAPSPYNTTEVAMSSLDHSLRLWDFALKKEQILCRGNKFVDCALDWNTAEYWNTPRTFVIADKDAVSVVDSRINPNATATKFVSFASNSTFDEHEKITALKPNALDSMHLTVGTTHNVLVYDMRHSSSPLVSWKHHYPILDPPIFLENIIHDRYSESHSVEKACSIIAASKHKSQISTFSYSQKTSIGTKNGSNINKKAGRNENGNGNGNGNPAISLSRNYISSFHTHETIKLQLLDCVSTSQFGLERIIKKIKEDELFPLPRLEGFSVDVFFQPSTKKSIESDAKNTCGSKSGSDSSCNVFQVGSDGSVFSQFYHILKTETQQENKAGTVETQLRGANNQGNLAAAKKEQPESEHEPGLYSSTQVSRSPNLDITDGNGHVFISYMQNHKLLEDTKIISSANEWPFFRRNFRHALQYLYGSITRKKLWFSHNETNNFKVFERNFKKNSSLISQVVDEAIIFALKFEKTAKSMKHLSGIVTSGKLGDPNMLDCSLRPELSPQPTMRTYTTSNKLASEIISVATQHILFFYKMGPDGKLFEKFDSAAKLDSSVFLDCGTIINPISTKLNSIVENRVFNLMMFKAFGAELESRKRLKYQRIFSAQFLEALSHFTINAIPIPGLGKVGIQPDDTWLCNKFAELGYSFSLNDLVKAIANKSNKYMLGDQFENRAGEKSKMPISAENLILCQNTIDFADYSWRYAIKDLLFSTTVLRYFSNNSENPGSSSNPEKVKIGNSFKLNVNKGEIQTKEYFQNLKLTTPPKLPTTARALDRMWDKYMPPGSRIVKSTVPAQPRNKSNSKTKNANTNSYMWMFRDSDNTNNNASTLKIVPGNSQISQQQTQTHSQCPVSNNKRDFSSIVPQISSSQAAPPVAQSQPPNFGSSIGFASSQQLSMQTDFQTQVLQKSQLGRVSTKKPKKKTRRVGF